MKRCDEIRAGFDSWIDGEGSPAAREEIAGHLEHCPECAGIVAQRRMFRARLRSAVQLADAPDARLKAEIRSQITSGRATQPRWPYLAIAAAVLIGFGIYGTWRGPGAVMEVGVRQHVHCAVDRIYPAQAPSPAEMVRELGQDYAGLLPVVEKNVPPEYHVVMAHHCSYKDRKYVHLVARSGGKLISLLITAREGGEAFQNDLRAVADEAGAELYSARDQRLSVAGFETPKYLVYLVSDLDEGRNLRVFQAMMPAVKTALS